MGRCCARPSTGGTGSGPRATQAARCTRCASFRCFTLGGWPGFFPYPRRSSLFARRGSVDRGKGNLSEIIPWRFSVRRSPLCIFAGSGSLPARWSVAVALARADGSDTGHRSCSLAAALDPGPLGGFCSVRSHGRGGQPYTRGPPRHVIRGRWAYAGTIRGCSEGDTGG